MNRINSSLVVNNIDNDPVNLDPVVVNPEQSVFVDRTSGIPMAFPKLTIDYSAASVKRQTTRIDISFDHPVTRTVDGNVAVVGTCRFKSYFVVPENLSVAERQAFTTLVVNSLSNTQVRKVYEDLDPMF